MSTLSEQQFPIDQAIFAEVLGVLPKPWTKAKLVASQTTNPSGGTSLKVRIDGLGQPGIAVVSDDLQDRVRELFVLHNKLKTDLQGIAYSYTVRPDGKWAWTGAYDYAP